MMDAGVAFIRAARTAEAALLRQRKVRWVVSTGTETLVLRLSHSNKWVLDGIYDSQGKEVEMPMLAHGLST